MFDSLKDKIGPFPAWVWGLILGAVAVGYVMLTGSRSNTATGKTAEPIAAGALDDFYNYAPANSAGVNGAGTIVNASEEATNFVWTANAITWLIGQRYSPLDAQRALSRYIDGETLTAAEAKMVDLVIAKFGIPPQGVYGTSDVAKSAPATPAPAPTVNPYLAKIRDLYKRYLGRTPSDAEIAARAAKLAAGQSTIAAEEKAIAGSAEATKRKIAEWYSLYLRRSPSAPESAWWYEKSKTMTLEQIRLAIYNSPEAKAKR